MADERSNAFLSPKKVLRVSLLESENADDRRLLMSIDDLRGERYGNCAHFGFGEYKPLTSYDFVLSEVDVASRFKVFSLLSALPGEDLQALLRNSHQLPLDYLLQCDSVAKWFQLGPRSRIKLQLQVIPPNATPSPVPATLKGGGEHAEAALALVIHEVRATRKIPYPWLAARIVGSSAAFLFHLKPAKSPSLFEKLFFSQRQLRERPSTRWVAEDVYRRAILPLQSVSTGRMQLELVNGEPNAGGITEFLGEDIRDVSDLADVYKMRIELDSPPEREGVYDHNGVKLHKNTSKNDKLEKNAVEIVYSARIVSFRHGAELE